LGQTRIRRAAVDRRRIVDHGVFVECAKGAGIGPQRQAWAPLRVATASAWLPATSGARVPA
jgi:hypothetical protein